MKRLILVTAFILVALIRVSAQNLPVQNLPTQNLPAQTFSEAVRKPLAPTRQETKAATLWQWDDALLIGSLAADAAGTHYALNNCTNCREAGAIKNAMAQSLAKVGVFSLFKFYEWKHPENRQRTKWFKVAIAAGLTAIAVNNFRQGRQ